MATSKKPQAIKRATSGAASRRKSRQSPPPKQSSLTKLILVAVVAAVILALLVIYQTIYAQTDRAAQTLSVGKGDTYHSLLSKEPWTDSVLASRFVTKAYLSVAADKP